MTRSPIVLDAATSAPFRGSRAVDRDDRLRELGWVVLRVMADQLQDPDAVAARVLAELSARGWRP